MDYGVDLQLAHELADDRKARVRVHEVHLLEGAYRVDLVAPEEKRHLRRQPSGDLSSEWVRDARHEDTMRGEGRHYLPI